MCPSLTQPHKESTIPVPDLYNWNTDRSVDVATMVRGGMSKTSGGSWVYNSNPTTFQISTTEMATAGTDYSALLPEYTKMVQINIRGVNGYMISCATVSAVSGNSYFTLYDSQAETIGGHGCNFNSQSLWFCGSNDAMIVEMVIYK